jgi:GNAT superfamily N-acetyltransferase
MVRISIVQPIEYMHKIVSLMRDNWDETGFDFEFNPSADAYQKVVDCNAMFVIAAFDGDDVIGYCTMIISPHLHNPDVIVASNDALFVAKPYRNGMTSGRLIKAAEDEAKRRGASKVLWHTRAGTSFAAMLERRGYQPSDIVVMKGF